MTESQSAARYFSNANLCDEEIEEVDVTYGFVVEKLIQGWPEFQETAEKGFIKSVYIKKMTSNEPASNNFRFVATFLTDQVLSAVIKASDCKRENKPDKDSEAERFCEQAERFFDCEAEFYRRFGGESVIPGFPIHEIYYSRTFSDNQTEDAYIPPMLIMEDLTQVTQTVACDLQIDNSPEELSEDQVKSIIKALASLHKHILCMKDDKWKDSLMGMSCYKFLLETMDPLVNEGTNYFGDVYRRLQRTMTGDFVNYAWHDFPLQIELPEMLIVIPSVFFSNDDPSSIAAFADFRLVSLGSPAIDLERFITLASHKYKYNLEMRFKFETDNFTYYYEILSQKMGEEGHELTFTPEQLMRSYRLCKVVCASETLTSWATKFHRIPILRGLFYTVSGKKKVNAWKAHVVAAANEAVEILQQDAPEWLFERERQLPPQFQFDALGNLRHTPC